MEAFQKPGQEQYIDSLAVLAKLMPNDTADGAADMNAQEYTDLYIDGNISDDAAGAAEVDRAVAASSYPVVHEVSVHGN